MRKQWHPEVEAKKYYRVSYVTYVQCPLIEFSGQQVCPEVQRCSEPATADAGRGKVPGIVA